MCTAGLGVFECFHNICTHLNHAVYPPESCYISWGEKADADETASLDVTSGAVP